MSEKVGPSQQWFLDFLARRGKKNHTRRSAKSPLVPATAPPSRKSTKWRVICGECREREVSKGLSEDGLAAAKHEMCRACYMLLIKKQTLCVDCEERPIAGGKSIASVYARAKQLCHHCYKHYRSDVVEEAHEVRRTERERIKTRLAKQEALPRCCVCDHRAVAQGDSEHIRRARKRSMCWRCYNHSGAARKMLDAERAERVKEVGGCRLCKTTPISQGKSKGARYARKNGLCQNCYQTKGVRGRLEELEARDAKGS